MASINKRSEKNAKKPYVLSYLDPVQGKWQKATFVNENDANEELRRWENIAHYHKTNNPIWHAMYYQTEETVTIKDVFDAFTVNVLDKKNNMDTVSKYEMVMKSVETIFPFDTPVDNIRSMKKSGLLGWEIYKSKRNEKCTRNGVNSYLRDLRHIFNWARVNGGSQGRGMVNFEVVTKNDKYNASEVNQIVFKVWTDEEILTLFNHTDLSEFQKDLLTVYTYTGARATELLGYNYKRQDKVLEWHHVDFNDRTISLLPKRKYSRKLAKQHPIVMDILRKWKEEGQEKPLPFGYKKLRGIIADINETTGIQFTCHDLRRLKAQLAEEENGDIQLAGYAIGDSTKSVVSKHYAPVSHATMDKINDSIDNAFNRKMGVA